MSIIFADPSGLLALTMFNLHELDNETLLDLLAEYTAIYTELLVNENITGTTEELEFARELVRELTEEIELRKKSGQHDIPQLNDDNLSSKKS